MSGKSKQSTFEMIIGAKDKFSSVFGRFGAKMGALSKTMKDVERDGEKLGQGLSWIGSRMALALGLGSGCALTLARHLAGVAGEAAKSASRVGMHLNTWQEYAYAAERAGLSSGELESALGSLQEKAKSAFKGDADSAFLLKGLGLDAKSAGGKVQAASVMLTKLADRIKALKDSGEHAKAADLAKQFGVSGMLPLLEKGGMHLEEMRKRAHDIGLVFGDEDAAASKKFSDSLQDSRLMLRGLGFSLFRDVIPPISRLMERFTQWIDVQRKLVDGGKFASWLKDFDVDTVWNSIEAVLEGIKDLVSAVDGAAQFFGGWKNVLMGIAAFMAGKFLLSLVNAGVAFAANPLFLKGASLVMTLAKAFFTLGAAILTTPVGWLLAACAAIGAAVYAVYKNWDGIVSYFSGLWQGVKDAFNEGWTDGILKILWDFNPLRLILKGMNELIAYFTGFNLFETIGKQWGAQLTGWMPDSLKKFLGLEAFSGSRTGEAYQADDAASGGFGGFAAPAGWADPAMSLHKTRSEHVERNEVRLKIDLPAGADAQLSGKPGEGVSLQTGLQAVY
jgi:hypothetical protein